MRALKRSVTVTAVFMVVTQMFGVGPALASSDNDECDFSRGDLEVTLGNDQSDIFINGERLFCFAQDGSASASVASVKSISVTMDDESRSTGTLKIYVDNGVGTTAAVWPSFETFDIDVTTRVTISGENVGGGGGNLRFTVGPKTVSFNGTVATSNAPSYLLIGGPMNDTIDGSTATAKLEVVGGGGRDLIKGGSGKDRLRGSAGFDTIYGGAGNDYVECGGEADLRRKQFEYGWGQDGDDYIYDCNVAGPGRGDDEVDFGNAGYIDLFVTYADVAGGIEWTYEDGEDPVTGGAAGDDRIEGYGVILGMAGGGGDDVIWDERTEEVYGNAGDDVIRTGYHVIPITDLLVSGGAGDDLLVDVSADGYDSVMYGGAGNDVLRGKGGEDLLVGGAGNDQAWGGPGEDTCGAEVVHSCEVLTRRA